MAASASPAVIIQNIPSHLKRNGQTVSEVVLGSKTGKEVGVAFWKIHQSEPKFMVVFKHLTDRDTWVRTSSILQEAMAKHGLEVTRVIIINIIKYLINNPIIYLKTGRIQQGPWLGGGRGRDGEAGPGLEKQTSEVAGEGSVEWSHSRRGEDDGFTYSFRQ